MDSSSIKFIKRNKNENDIYESHPHHLMMDDEPSLHSEQSLTSMPNGQDKKVSKRYENIDQSIRIVEKHNFDGLNFNNLSES